MVLFLDYLHALDEMHEGEVKEGLVGRGLLVLRGSGLLSDLQGPVEDQLARTALGSLDS